MRKLPYLLLLIIAAAIVSDFGKSCGIRAENKTAPATVAPPEYISPTPGKFPIIAWNPYYVKRTPTILDFQRLISCGFNSTLLNVGFEDLYPLIPKIKDLDVSLILNLSWFSDNYKDSICYQLMKQLRSYVNSHAHPGLLAGYLVKDEPILKQIDNVKSIHNAVTAADPAALAWVNLLGEPTNNFMSNEGARSNFSDSQNQRDLVKEYLSTFCNAVNPMVLSYDFYPIKQVSADSLEIYFNDFFYDLALYAHTSKARGIPFWAFCETANYIYRNPESPEIYPQRPIATEEYLRFEAFNALALGAQGIVYWSYAMQDPNDNGYYQSAVVDKNGNPGPSWNAVKQINKEIKEHSDVFLGATLEGYMFVGNQYRRPSEIIRIPGPTANGKFSVSRYSGKGALVSRLSNKGKTYIVIVNQDPVKRSTLRFGYQVKLDTCMPMDTMAIPSIINPGHNGLNPIALRDSIPRLVSVTRHVTLEPSQYIIYQIPDSTK